MSVIVHGMRGSSNVQSVLMALDEKAVAYELRTPPFAAYKQAPYTVELHPFGMVPAFEHADFKLYETVAILHYVNDAFAGVGLVPKVARLRARMHQVIAVAQAYLKGPIAGGGSINYYRLFAPKIGVQSDEASIARALPQARLVIGELERLLCDPFFAGRLSLADLMVAPILYVFRRTPEGERELAATPKLRAWIDRMEARPSGQRMTLP